MEVKKVTINIYIIVIEEKKIKNANTKSRKSLNRIIKQQSF